MQELAPSASEQQTRILGITDNQDTITNEISNSKIQISNQFQNLNLKTNENINTPEELQESIDEQFAKADSRFKNYDLRMDDLESQIADYGTRSAQHETQIVSIEDLMDKLQKQMDDVEAHCNTSLPEIQTAQIEQNKTDIDYLKLLLEIDRVKNPEDISILGKIKAEDIEALGIVKAKEIQTESLKLADDKTSGKAEIKTGENEIAIETPYVTKKAKISLTPAGETFGRILFYDEVEEGKSFKVKIEKTAEEGDIHFDWFIVK